MKDEFEDTEEINEEEDEKICSEEEKEKEYTNIGNKSYTKDEMNRISIVRLTQCGIPQTEIRKLLKVSKALTSKWSNYEKIKPKKMGRPLKFSEEENEFIYKSSEGKLTILNKSSSRNIAKLFEEKFNKSVSKSHINDILLKKYGKPYRATNTILLTKDHVLQRLAFANEIIENGIKGSQIMFTDECRIVLYSKANPKINIIRLNEEDRKNIHSYEVNEKRTFSQPKFEVSIMVAGGISEYGLSNLVFCSGTMNNFSYKQFLLFLKKDMDNLKEKNLLEKDLIFQQDNASCHKSKESLEAIEVLFGDNKIWWPANSPDLSPIETVWAILKRELSKTKNSNLNELREHVLDIWSKFPVELCKKIVGEFDSKIKICQKEEGKILTKTLYKKYAEETKLKNKGKEYAEETKLKNEGKEYDWTSLKRDKCFRVVYNNKMIELLIKKVIKRIEGILKSQKNNYKKDFPKAKKGDKFIGMTYKQYNNKRKNNLAEINDAYQNIISYFKKISPLEFINRFLKRDLFWFY